MSKHNINGFTLIELLMILMIIGILSVAVYPNLLTARNRARDAMVLTHLREAMIVQEFYRIDNHVYTNSVASLNSLGLKAVPSVTLNIIDFSSVGYCMTASRTGSSTIFHATVSGGISDTTVSSVCISAN